MTEHLHTELVAGCYRCELSGDELEAAAAEKADRDRDYLNAETDRLEDESPTSGDA